VPRSNRTVHQRPDEEPPRDQAQRSSGQSRHVRPHTGARPKACVNNTLGSDHVAADYYFVVVAGLTGSAGSVTDVTPNEKHKTLAENLLG
jgi:hypothetical protein